jgi:subtilisin family serine protease
MKQPPFALLICTGMVLATTGWKAMPSQADHGQPGTLPSWLASPELAVRFRPEAVDSPAAAARVAAAALGSLARERQGLSAAPLFAESAASAEELDDIYRLTLPDNADVLATARALALDPQVAFVELNYRISLSQAEPPPDDLLFPYLWGLDNRGQIGGRPGVDVGAQQAWEITKGSRDVLVAVIDTGVDYRHPDLDDGRVRTDIDIDLFNKDDDAFDDNNLGHGTHVVGTIAAETNNGEGIAGVMWEAEILPIKIFGKGNFGNVFALGQAIVYAGSQGADIISMSLGGLVCLRSVAAAVNYAHFVQGAVVIAASGNNSGRVPINFPGRLGPVLTVGALGPSGFKADFSNFGPELDLVAPGTDIASALPGGRYDAYSGTSMATPHVAGVAGLLLAQRPELTNDQVIAILRASAVDLGPPGFDQFYGYGLVDAYQALQTPTPPAVPAASPASCQMGGVSAAGLHENGLHELFVPLAVGGS